MQHSVFIGLGSNLGNRYQLLQEALQLINSEVGNVEITSSFIETEPWGFVSSFAFLNCVAQVKTNFPPVKLLDHTQDIEYRLGRLHKSYNGMYQDRPIDIDLLLYDDLILRSKRLTLPHPLLHERIFVLESMVEIEPNLIHPLLGLTMQELLSNLTLL